MTALCVAQLSDRIESLSQRLANEVLPAHPTGFTFDPIGDRVLTAFYSDEYIVSLKGYERCFEVRPSLQQIKRWLRDHQEQLFVPGRFVGGWLKWQNGLFYLDISIVVRGRATVVRTGLTNGQDLVFHPATKTLIRLGESETEEAA